MGKHSANNINILGTGMYKLVFIYKTFLGFLSKVSVLSETSLVGYQFYIYKYISSQFFNSGLDINIGLLLSYKKSCLSNIALNLIKFRFELVSSL